ncbi:uncharacterized protein SAPINGB_P006235 [Magnusiomyces paraingens]|uniref:Cation/H+ exchanger domain-containing protein n=1 Tax=Magnusiomyces paraingens TaxID=2606893 RepID=A0A5E8C5W5_9ASCO|nr:uncharacterized protein SAPINGB_P006235 [Saprochaete ingens]VVT58490.1 unnamed protein product [Saprochaete ingens]
MAWDQLWINKPHLAYAVIGGFTTVFSLISLFVKEKLYIGEATVATIFGVIVGPHCLNWFSPTTWGNTDNITLEISRIVLVVQIFAVAVELPKKYMLRHWFSVTLLLIPVMTFGWLIASVFIWKLVPTLRWVEALVLAACVTATDPVLASAVVGKGKFAQRVPGHLRNLLSAESGCNDGMAFPFAYLALLCILHEGHHRQIAYHFIVITVIYECVFGTVLGAIIGYLGRHLIKFAEKHNLIDRESFLVSYFVIALFCTGVGSIIGVDDLLVAFAAGAAFSWDGWFARKTEESHVSDVIDLLLNMSFFVYFGAIVPWEQFNRPEIGILPWKLVIIAILIILFRRIPIMLFLKPVIPDIKTWREALFCGHFGPIGVGAIFMSILSRAELEHEEPTPLAELPGKDNPNYYAIATIWPVTCFLIISSIIVHGSSIAVFTLGKRLNNLTITMTYTTAGSQNQGWLSRLSRVESRTFSLRKVDTENQNDYTTQEKTLDDTTEDFPVIAASTNPDKPGLRHKHKKHHHKKQMRRRDSTAPPPVVVALDLNKDRNSQAISAPLHDEDTESTTRQIHITAPLPHDQEPGPEAILPNPEDVAAAYQLGNTIVLENDEGEVLHTVKSNPSHTSRRLSISSRASEIVDAVKNLASTAVSAVSSSPGESSDSTTATTNTTTLAPPPPSTTTTTTTTTRRRPVSPLPTHSSPPPPSQPSRRRDSLRRGSASEGPAGSHAKSRKVTAYQLDDNIIVENEEGEIIRRYHIEPSANASAVSSTTMTPSDSHISHSMLANTLSHFGFRRRSTVAQIDLERNTIASAVAGGTSSSGAAGTNAAGPSTSSPPPSDSRQRFPLDDERMRKHLKQLLISDPRVNPEAAQRQRTTTRDDSDYSSSSSSGSESYSSSDEEEDDDDDDVSPMTSKAGPSSSRPASAPPSSLPALRLGATSSSSSRATPSGVNASGATTSMGKSASSNLPRYDEEEEETEVEKARRLAALGLIKNED